MAELKNARHEAYAQGLAKGNSQRTAYRAAFHNSVKWKDATVDKRASELAQTGEILGRLRELAEAASSEAVMDVRQRLEYLTGIIRSSRERTADKLKAIDIINKMQGEYVQKVEAEVKQELNINVELVDE